MKDSHVVLEVPVPACGDNEILVANKYSAVSIGTESAGLGQPSGLIGKVLSDPKLLEQGLELLKSKGLIATIDTVMNEVKYRLTAPGYSTSGVVLEVGKNVNNFLPGDRVACAGSGYASHAEIVTIPSNLAVKVPTNVTFREASFTTIGAIALQGIRRANLQIGDRVAVIGLGLLGFVVLYLLKHWKLLDRWRISRFFVKISRHLSLVMATPKHAAVQLLLSVVVHFLSLLAIFLIGRSVELNFSLTTYLVLVPPAILLTLVPLSLAGWGIREGAMIGLFTLLGADKVTVLSMSILYGIVLIVASLPGLIVYMKGKHHI